MFIDLIDTYDWKNTTELIYSKTDSEVQAALQAKSRNLDDFMALISPAAEPYIEEMARQSQQRTLRRFGKTIQLYVPLYLSNFCENNCVYCGFNTQNRIKRKVLSYEEIKDEVIAIRKLGFEHILLVTGESDVKAGAAYLKKAFEIIKPHVSLISIEVQPLQAEEYADLIEQGLNTVYLYQETYNRERYPVYHLGGKKRDYENRLKTYENLGKAQVHKIGLGILAGLEDWRTDSFFTALHLNYLKRTYWRTKYSVSFPRLRPHSGSFQPNSIMTDRQLAQLIFAYRLFDENVEIALSTRESAHYRDHMLKLGVTSMSAESKTNPGGYAHPELNDELEQFAVNDSRTALEVANMIRSNGYEAVWKDWDYILQ
ncbi:2-iminoacetate synthase ThiH [Mangrovibacterium sp.]|uniref:2-iminoacetate synthase ThiH n=1 Tax=Mangrovibacterium sp. TaxID=1961364 RepID=UPI00356A2A0D